MAKKAVLFVWLCVAAAGAGEADSQSRASHLSRARKYVEQSDRYLHHSKIRPGTEGYGLTVLDGVEVVRFRAKILSVLSGMAPQRDMILALLEGPDEENFLQTSGIIAGMSGSPVYVKGPDGKDRMIGAVAYGWFAEKKPICGIQPITQMLAVSGLVDPRAEEAHDDARAQTQTDPKTSPSGKGALRYLKPEKLDFSRPISSPASPEPSGRSSMSALPIPLSVSISDPRRRNALASRLKPFGFVPVPAAGVAASTKEEVQDAQLAPGSAISVPLVTGDQDWTAVGTVTDVLDGHVLAFGHSFFGEGASRFPMGPAYVHTVIPTFNSFKIGSTIRLTGGTYRDENVAVVGKQGAKVEMIPLTVRYHNAAIDRTQTFRYRIVRNPDFTALLSFALISESFVSYSAPPEEHHVHYKIKADYGKLGLYNVENFSGAVGPGWVASDMSRMVGAMADNVFARPCYPDSIEVDMEVRKGNISSTLEQLRLDSSIVRPGRTLTGKVILEPYRAARTSLPVSIDVPGDLPEGNYELVVTGLLNHLDLAVGARPHLYSPENREELFAAVQRINAPPSRRLYLHIKRPRGGVALGTQALPNLPESRAEILAQSALPDVRAFHSLETIEIPTDTLPEGAVSARFTVRENPEQVPLADNERK
jgi:hypothetical protein